LIPSGVDSTRKSFNSTTLFGWPYNATKMRFSRLLIPVAISKFLISSPVTQTQSKTATTQENTATQTAPPKAINTPDAPYPEEALKKGIEGKVTLLIVIDGKGKVSQAKALCGPKELVSTALASVRMWQFEPPARAPVTETVEIEYGFRKECPGPTSESGEVAGSGRLSDKNGNLVAVVDDEDYRLPPYPETERKAGVAGNMILSVTLGPDGHVKEIHAGKSLSPTLDRAAIDAVRAWTFKKVEANADVSWENLRLQFIFRATCKPRFYADSDGRHNTTDTCLIAPIPYRAISWAITSPRIPSLYSVPSYR
jgi:TonB family protein